LGIKVAASTVWEILQQAGIDPAPERTSTTWASFLRSQADADAATRLHVRRRGYPGTVRQLVITGLGRDQPTVIITNDTQITTKALITHYARRMTIEQRLAEIIQAFCADALSSAVNLNVDLDVVLCVLAQALTAAFRLRLPGNYAHVTPDTLQRRFLDPRRDHQRRHQHHRQDQPPRLLTRPPPRRPARRHHRPLVGRTPASLRIRLTKGRSTGAEIRAKARRSVRVAGAPARFRAHLGTPEA
jgi:hypothetical protein